jgi:hypothetical protein
MLKRMLAAIGLGTSLFLVNQIGVIAGALQPPPGYEPAWFTRNLDTPHNLTSAVVAQQRHWLVPDYDAPWITEGALFHPLFQIIGRCGLPIFVSYYVFDILFYWMAAWALIEVARTFCRSRRQMFYAALMVVCALPLKLFGFALARPLHFPTPVRLWMGAGLIDYVLTSSDGLARGGLSNSVTLTLGTAIMLFSFANLAKFVGTGRRANYYWLVACVFLGAVFHPFEIFIITVAAVWPLWSIRRRWESVMLFVAAGVGFIPQIIQSMRSPWVHDASDLARDWRITTPVWVLEVYGIPAILICWLLLIRFRMERPEDRVLQSWFITTLLLPLVPGLPSAMHFFDGFVYCVAILLVRKAYQDRLFERLFRERPKTMRAGLGAAVAASILTLFVAYAQLYKDGKSADPDLLSAVVPKAEVAMIRWMKENLAHREVATSLVLAPDEMAPWVATIPMPSLGSHDVMSITYFSQRDLAHRFYKGEDVRRELIDGFGVSYVVIPASSPAVIASAQLVHTEGDLKLYRVPGETMRPYSESPKLDGTQRNELRQRIARLLHG